MLAGGNFACRKRWKSRRYIIYPVAVSTRADYLAVAPHFLFNGTYSFPWFTTRTRPWKEAAAPWESQLDRAGGNRTLRHIIPVKLAFLDVLRSFPWKARLGREHEWKWTGLEEAPRRNYTEKHSDIPWFVLDHSDRFADRFGSRSEYFIHTRRYTFIIAREIAWVDK